MVVNLPDELLNNSFNPYWQGSDIDIAKYYDKYNMVMKNQKLVIASKVGMIETIQNTAVCIQLITVLIWLYLTYIGYDNLLENEPNRHCNLHISSELS